VNCVALPCLCLQRAAPWAASQATTQTNASQKDAGEVRVGDQVPLICQVGGRTGHGGSSNQSPRHAQPWNPVACNKTKPYQSTSALHVFISRMCARWQLAMKPRRIMDKQIV
jgi:hypothetical protein